MKEVRLTHKKERKPIEEPNFHGPYLDNDGNQYRDIHDLFSAGWRYFWSKKNRKEPRLQKIY